MTKIIQVLNSIISDKSKITNVIRGNLGGNSEYYFLYNNKYKWSIAKNSDEEYFVHLYPETELTLSDLADPDTWNHSTVSYVTYSTKDLKTQEAEETFRELYQIVSDKLFGIDDIFNDIILGSTAPF
ncbi:MAG: hypothetical protein LBU91_00530 [Bacteroidales bacterium]|jgi:hypothetical protein|nr:hypothetical protein [Bacteroidales bacterium]